MYTNKHKFNLIMAIQDITLEYKGKGCTQEWIYHNIIYPRFYISKTTYYRYLGINAKRLSKKL